MIQGLLVLNDSTYVYERWHGTLFVIAILSFCIIFNTFLAQRLPMVEGSILVLHITGFFAIIIPLWILAPRNSAKMVFTEFENLGGWSSQGLSFLVGLLSPIYALLGVDSAVHMSEETRDASLVLPRATFLAILINGGFGFVMMITFCFTMGSPAVVLQTYTGYPFIQAFYDVTNSYAGATIMVVILVVTITSSCISTVATVSRQMWAFARDRALPFSSVISHVSLTTCLATLGFHHDHSNITSTGQTRLEHPTQRRPAYLASNLSALVDQHRKYGRLQRHRLKFGNSLTHDLHHLHHLRDPPQSPWSSSTTTPVESRSLRPTHQRGLSSIPPLHLDFRSLPYSHSGNGTDHELELPHLRRDNDSRGRLLLCCWKEILYRSRRFGSAKFVTGPF